MKYYGVCQCLYQQYRLFYHVDCDKQHDQNSFPMVITFIITTTRGRDNVCRRNRAVISQEYMSSPGSPITNYI